MDGNSARQGGHHEAQKLINTTLPRNDDVFSTVPFSSENSKSILAWSDLSTLLLSILALKSPVAINCRRTNDFASGLTNITPIKPTISIVKPFFLMYRQNLF